MSFDDRLRHNLVIERAAAGAEDDYGQPSRTYAALATVPGLIQPKTAREQALTTQAGVPVSTHVIYLRPTDLREADRVAYGGVRYEVTGIRDAAGLGHHLEVDARLIGGRGTIAVPTTAALVLTPRIPVVS